MFRSLLDYHQIHKELKYATCNEFLWYTRVNKNPSV